MKKTLKWIEEDLSYVPKGTLIFWLRIFQFVSLRKKDLLIMITLCSPGETINAKSLFKLLEGYETHFLTGHLHSNSNVVFNGTIWAQYGSCAEFGGMLMYVWSGTPPRIWSV